jgi:hypothetical protein
MDNEYRVPKPQDAEGRIPKGPDFAEKRSPVQQFRVGTKQRGEFDIYRECNDQEVRLLLRFFGRSWGPA